MATTTGEVRRPRVKLHFKIKELELALEADKEDMPQLSNRVARQLASLVEPVAAAATMSPRGLMPASPTEADDNGHEAKARKTRAARSGGQNTPAPAAFAHDVEQWGFPDQKFTTQGKSMYMLFISEAQGGPKELPAGTIATWFNQHFKSAGAVRPSNVSKYLREALAAKPALVGEDVTKSPSVWYLTTEGRKAAEQLVIKARGSEKR